MHLTTLIAPFPTHKDRDSSFWQPSNYHKKVRSGLLPDRVQDDAVAASSGPAVVVQSVGLDQRFVPKNDTAAVLDSGAMVHVCGIRGPLGKGSRCKLQGATGDTADAERADVEFVVKTVDGKPYKIFMQV